MTLGVIGCGNMGAGMVARLLECGCDVICFDTDETTLQKISQIGAVTATSIRDLAGRCDRIILSLPKAAVVRTVMTEIAPHTRGGAIILDTSTSEPETSQDMAALGADHDFSFVDGPVSGGTLAARSGTMTMLFGGDAEAINNLRPLTELLTAKTVIVGGSGAGHAAKIANNMLCAANLVLVAEAVRLGKAAGVEAKALLEGINAGSGRSGVSQVNFQKWILNGAFDSGFTMGLMRKDVGLALTLADEKGVALDGFSAIADIWLAQSNQISDAADFNEITKYMGKGEGA